MSVEGLDNRGPNLWSVTERFVDEGVLIDDRVRPEIVSSWRRSRQSGVRAAGDPATRHTEVDPAGRLLRLARPVLDRLADQVSSADMIVILTDPAGLVLDRRAGSPALRAGLDRVLLAPGYSYAEESVGTNGIGTAAEMRDVAWVVGSEHYVEWLRWLSCAGAPIRNPVTGRVEGVLDLTCRFKDTSPLMVPFIKEGAREIEQLLYEDATQRERELLDRFVAIARRSSRPVVALNGHTVIANAAAARLLEPADHALLWNYGAEAIDAGARAARGFRLSQGSLALMRCVDLVRGDRERGVVLEIDIERAEAVPARTRGVTPELRPPAVLPGRSLAWQQAWTAAAEQASTRLPVLVLGEPGTGKLALARLVHEQSGRAGAFTVLDATLARIDGEAAWLAAVRTRLAEPDGMVVLRHLEALDAATAQSLAGVLSSAAPLAAAPRIVATATVPADAGPPEEVPLYDGFPAVLRVPPLRVRPEDISDIVPALIRRHVEGPSPRCSPDLMQALMRADWPGNVRQLESLIQGMVARRPAGELTLRDLPSEFRRGPWRRLSPMERAERAAILEALSQTGGSKVQAAALLGIGRATLYRKLRDLGIPDPRETFT